MKWDEEKMGSEKTSEDCKYQVTRMHYFQLYFFYYLVVKCVLIQHFNRPEKTAMPIARPVRLTG